MQLVQLQEIVPQLRETGVVLYGLSYDPVDVLSTFTRAHDISFPLLADEGSRVIRSLGMLDTEIEEHHAAFGIETQPHHRGVARPAIFVLDEDGRVTGVVERDNYRIRDTATTLLMETLGIDQRWATREVTGSVLQLRVSSDTPAYWWFERFRLIVELDIEEGWHLYAAPAPEGLIGATIELDHVPGLTIEPVRWEPEPESMPVAGVEGPVAVHHGTVRAAIPMVPTGRRESPDLELTGRLRFQACDDEICLMPSSMEFELTIPGRREISDELYG